MNLFKIAEKLHDYLRCEGVEFSNDGYPIITEDMILKTMPEQILPVDQKYAARNKSKTLLVTFSKDESVYKRLIRLEEDIHMYKEYMGIGGFDLSPRINWDISLQKFNICLNMMADAFLATRGIKIMPNFRTGCLETMSVLANYPKNAWYIVGSLGCAKGHIKLNELYLRTKILLTNPDHLIYYGKLLPSYSSILDEMGVSYTVFTDFQRISRGKEIA